MTSSVNVQIINPQKYELLWTLSKVVPLLLTGSVFGLEDSSEDDGLSTSSGASDLDLESQNSSFHNFCRPLEDYGPRLSFLLHLNDKKWTI